MSKKIVSRHVVARYGPMRLEHRIERVADANGWSPWRVRAFVRSHPFEVCLLACDFGKRSHARRAYRWLKRYRGTVTYDRLRKAGNRGK